MTDGIRKEENHEAEILKLRKKIADLEKLQSEYKRVNEALKDTEARYKALFDHSLNYVYIIDFEGRFLDANEAALKVTGHTREEIPFITIADLLDRKQLTIAFQLIRKIKKGQQIGPFEFELKKKDGSFIWVETEAFLIYHEGKPFAIQGIARDITGRKDRKSVV
jgi:PAS domain S-box-containing protein